MIDVIGFYRGGTTPDGMTFTKFMSMNSDELETTHHYIQWVFPNLQRSRFNLRSPILTPYMASQLKDHSSDIQMALDKMIDFFGIGAELDENKISVWARPEWDHNQLRISRIITFLRQIGAHSLALDFYNRVQRAAEGKDVCPTTSNYWLKASIIPVLSEPDGGKS
jgi:hypothetical protein